MHENYIRDLIKFKADIEAGEENAIYEKGNLSTLKKSGAMLNPLKEMIVKFIYLTNGFYKSDFKMLFAFSYDGQTIDKSLKELEADGYLIKQDTPYGNLYGLTKEGIAQIRCSPKYFSGNRKEVSLQDMKLDGETAYQKRKLLSYNVANHVFMEQLIAVYKKFGAMDNRERNKILARIYLKNIRYRDYLKMDRKTRKDTLLQTGFSPDEAEKIAGYDSFIPKYAEQFAEKSFAHIGYENLKNEQEYRDYYYHVWKNCIKIFPNFNTFYLLKDIQDACEYRELDIVREWRCNVTRHGLAQLWKGVKQTNPIFYMQQLEQCNKCLWILGNEVRSLTAKNAYKKKTDEAELKEILFKLSLLDRKIEELKAVRERLEAEFTFPVITSYYEGAAESELKPVTITRLVQNGIYFETDRFNERQINIKVMQQQEEAEIFSLHKKIGMVFQIARRLFPDCLFHVVIYACSEEQADFIKSILPRLADRLKSGRETALIGSLIEDNCQIISGRGRIEERYIFFNQLYQFLKDGAPS